MADLSAELQPTDVISDCELNSFDAVVRSRLYNCDTTKACRF